MITTALIAGTGFIIVMLWLLLFIRVSSGEMEIRVTAENGITAAFILAWNILWYLVTGWDMYEFIIVGEILAPAIFGLYVIFLTRGEKP